MRYKLTFKKLTIQDVSADCPFLPDDPDGEKYEMHLNAIIEDIKSINGVVDANLSSDGTVTVVTDEMNKKIFSDQLEPFLKRDFCYLRLIEML